MIPNTPSSSQQYLPSDVQPESKKVEQQEETYLSEEELRQLYDQEEIERFLRLFSAYVKEVQLPEVPEPIDPENQDTSNAPNVTTAEDGEWTAVREDLPPISSILHETHSSTQYSSHSEEIACRYVAPFLPGPRPHIPEFTFGRLRLALERMYIFVLPIYLPLFYSLKKLAIWQDRFTSSIYCTIYWTLWWYNLLFPALVGRILFSLVRRKIWAYPSLKELRNYRMELDEADKFGEMMAARMSSSSVVTEVWRLFRLADQTLNITKKHVKGKEKVSVDEADSQSTPRKDNAELVTSREERDIKKYGLFLLSEIVDLHERIRNIFIWRKPVSSQRYGIALAILFFVSLLPAKYISKLAFFGIGFLFWHVSPIIAALPHSEKRRIPSPFGDVPTDVEYAMHLISERVAAGLEVNPGKMGKRDLASTHLCSSETSQSAPRSTKKTLFGGSHDANILHPRKGIPVPARWSPINPLVTTLLSIAQPQAGVMETHTYLCQHSSGPGLITLTHNMLFFTPLMSHNAKLVIPLSAVKGVKKAGMLKGLLLRWTNLTDESQEQKEEKFHLVGNRDELFARLIGMEGGRWVKV